MDLCVCDLEELRCAQAVPGRSGLTIPFGVSHDGGIAMSERFLKGTLGWGWVWDLKEKKPRHRLGDWEQATALAVSPDGRLGHAACQDGTIRVWDLATGLRTHVLTGHEGPASSLAPSLDGRFTLTAGADGTVRVWDLVTGECLRTLEGHTGQISVVRLSADSRIAVSGGEDHTMRVWELDWDYEFRREAE
jgi:WD40 repeat protein